MMSIRQLVQFMRTQEKSYDAFNRMLNGKNSLKLANNVCLIKGTGNGIHVMYHETYIVTYWKDETIELNTGGYTTKHTQLLMNAFLPDYVRVSGKHTNYKKDIDVEDWHVHFDNQCFYYAMYDEITIDTEKHIASIQLA